MFLLYTWHRLPDKIEIPGAPNGIDIADFDPAGPTHFVIQSFVIQNSIALFNLSSANDRFLKNHISGVSS
jgi:hypothetical protein